MVKSLWQDAQFIESQKFTIEQIARLYKVPLPLIGELDRATFNNIHELNEKFYSDTRSPLAENWELSFSKDLIPEELRRTYSVEFDLKQALRGSFQTLVETCSTAFHSGFMNYNEIKERLEENPLDPVDYPWAEDYFVGWNLTTPELSIEQTFLHIELDRQNLAAATATAAATAAVAVTAAAPEVTVIPHTPN